ncbi:MAG: hypothetical protein AB1567_03060 [bacterium]
MVEVRLFIVILFILLSAGTVVFLRIYFRAKMKGYLLMGIGSALCAIVFGITAIFFKNVINSLRAERIEPGVIFAFILVCSGGVLGAIGQAILFTIERGKLREIRKNTSISQWLRGDVPIIKDE